MPSISANSLWKPEAVRVTSGVAACREFLNALSKEKDARAGKGDVALWHNVAALRPSATRVGGNELAEHAI